MTAGFYIAHIPLKYFRDLSLDLFPGKLIRGRVISSSEDGTIRIELGGAILQASSKRVFQKGETITLRVKGISPRGVSLEIVDIRTRQPISKVEPLMSQKTDTHVKELFTFRESLEKLLDTVGSPSRAINEKVISDTLNALLRAGEKHDFFFLAVPIKLPDNKPRHLELIMRKAKEKSRGSESQLIEYIFSLTTAHLGEIVGRIYHVGKRLRIDLKTSELRAVEKLKGISEALKASINKVGFNVTSMNISYGKTEGPLESLILNEQSF